MVDIWRALIQGANKSWVLFRHGTCVILLEPAGDLAVQAAALLAEWGPVHAGTPSGDFNVIHLSAQPGWVVTGHHPDILNYVGPDDVGPGAPDPAIGLLGRSVRDQDARDLTVVHVEDRRG